MEMSFWVEAGLNKKFFFVFGRFIAARRRPAARAQQIDSDFDSLHQCGSFLHRPPDTMLELRTSFFHGFKGAGQKAAPANELPAHTTRGTGQNAINFFRLS